MVIIGEVRGLMKELKIIQLFESYSEFYQPYIPPVIEALEEYDNIKLQVDAFKGASSARVNIIPSYYKRKIKEHLFAANNKTLPKLNYVEINYLKNKVDIIHLQHSYLHQKLKGLLMLGPESIPKIVITLRGADTYMKPWLETKWINFYKSYGQNVDAYITMTEHQKKYLQKWGIAAKKIHAIPISYGSPFSVESKQVNKNCIKLLSAFRMCWEKNIEGNLRVVKKIKEKGINVSYDIYGSGADAHQIPYLIDKYNLFDNVTYHGSIENGKLKEKIQTSDFYLQLSHSESLGMSVIEAQTYGLPAIVSDSDGLPEVVLHEKTGYCVKPFDINEAANYIELLWKSPTLYSDFSKAAIEHSQSKFSISREVGSLHHLYKTLITK